MEQLSKMLAITIFVTLVLVVPAKSQAHNMSTHLLDCVSGINAVNVSCEVFSITGNNSSHYHYHFIDARVTDSTGRIGDFILAEDFIPGLYLIRCHVRDYFISTGLTGPVSIFPFDEVEFRITDTTTDYHIPMIVCPYLYSTYRGKLF